MLAPIQTLETDRLRIRPLSPEDAPFILELLNEPAWLEFIGDRGVRTLDDARSYVLTGPVSMYARDGVGLLAVETKDRGATIGICGLIKRDTLPDVDIGFAFLERFWGQGYAHEAAAAVLAQGTKMRRLTRVVALTTPGNERSGRLLRKLGFHFERLIRLKQEQPESRLWALTLPSKT